jgi:hypothetical protein
MYSKKYLGVTLLFARKNSNNVEARLNSYVVRRKNVSRVIDGLKEKERKLHNLTYLGAEDFFNVSGKPTEYSILGKSFLEDINTISQCKKLAKPALTYSITKTRTIYKWVLISAIYFYEDKSKGDTVGISCLILIKTTRYLNNRMEVRSKLNSHTVKRKIISKQIDKMDSHNLSFIGLENVSYVQSNTLNNSPFQTFYRGFKGLKPIKSMLPKQSFLNTKKKAVLKVCDSK